MSQNNSTHRTKHCDLEHAIDAFRRGNPVCIYDADEREGETDLVYPAGAVTPPDVTRLRNDAGGLVCVALAHDVAEAFGLPYFQELCDHPASRDPNLKYGTRSSFSVTVNHRDTFTGITDEDRALTISALGRVATQPEAGTFEDRFRIPGHVQLLKGAPNLLRDRQGHTELALALADVADREPAAVVCEMLDDDTGDALTPAGAREYAGDHDIPYVDGAQIVTRVE